MKKVILHQNVETLGSAGEVVKVSDGYARNFLIPRKLAVFSDEKNDRQFQHQKQMVQHRLNREVGSAKALAAKIESVSCTISRKAGEEDKLFGSVNNKDIEEALKLEGIEIDRKHILLSEPIKILGVFTIPIKIHKDVTANLKLWIVKED